MKNEKIYSPISGQIVPIEQVSDPVFSEKMLGDGIAVRSSISKHFIVSPCDGEIQTIHSSLHAVAILNNEGYEVLIHVGVDTVNLEGKGFQSLVSVGQKVKKGENLLLVDFDFISKNAPSYDVVMLITNMTDDYELTKNTSNSINVGEHIFSINQKGFPTVIEATSSQSKETISESVVVVNHTGIHARPASKIFQIANKYKSTVELKLADKQANAKSVISILGLGIKFNDVVQLIASGDDAKLAVEELIVEFKNGLGDDISIDSSNTIKKESEEEVKSQEEIDITDFSSEVILNGVLASPGLIIGKSFFIEEEEISFIEDSSDIENEINVLEFSLNETKEKLLTDIKEAKSLKQKTKVEVFSAHLTMLNDPTLFDFAKEVILKGKTAAYAWNASVKNSIDILKSTKDALLIERVADLKDIKKRVIHNILGLEQENKSYPKDTVIVAKDLVPSDLAQFDDNIRGVVLAHGSATSHVALILRNMGIPALVAVGKSVLNIKGGTSIILDANDGVIFINPDNQKIEDTKIKKEKLETKILENIANAKKPAITIDGHRIYVKGNVSNGNEAKQAFEMGGEGVGLLRTEFLFFNTKSEPNIDEQHQLYQFAVDAMQGGCVTLRTLDVGGDKPLSFVKIGEEENPIMGLRGVRNYFINKEVFLNQIRAILKVKPLLFCKIMIPMISEIDEIIKVREIIEEEMEKQGIKEKVEIGTMIEVPSSAIIADKIAKYVDFLSIGTNDLAQYTLAMDRGNYNLTSRLKNLNPSLLKLIKMTVEGGLKYDKPVSVCGAMASEIQSIPILIGLGITELSTSMKSIADVKAFVRMLSYEKCVEVANKALDMETSEQVIELVNKEFFSV